MQSKVGNPKLVTILICGMIGVFASANSFAQSPVTENSEIKIVQKDAVQLAQTSIVENKQKSDPAFYSRISVSKKCQDKYSYDHVLWKECVKYGYATIHATYPAAETASKGFWYRVSKSFADHQCERGPKY